MNNKLKGMMMIILVMAIINLSEPLKVKAVSTNDTNMTFKRITIEDGLSQTSIEYLYQDSDGYMWIGTADGLNRYNGHEFDVYRYKEGSNTIAANYIAAINEDTFGDLWIGTSKGLNKISKETNEISTYLPSENGEGISHYNICEILVDSKGDVFVATQNGLNIYNRETDSFERILNSNELTSQFIYSIVEDENGAYWIGTDKGLNMYNSDTGEVKQFLYDEKNENTISSNSIFKLYIDNVNNKLFIGTSDNGLSVLDINNYGVVRYIKDSNDKDSIPGNFITSILRDSRGLLWVGTDEGFARLDEAEGKFILYKSKVYDTQSIVSDNILSICEDKSGTIWVGTFGGISLFNPDNIFKVYKHNPFDDNSISEASVQGIYEDNEGLLWVGTSHSGLNSLDRKNNIIKRYINESGNEKSLIDDNINEVVGIDNEIWIATELGISKFDKNTNEFTNYKSTDSENSLPKGVVRTLYIDSDGLLWIGTSDGLASFDRKDTFVNYKELFKSKGITEHMFSDIYEDRDGTMWFGSALDGGLIKYDKETGEIKNYKNNKSDKNSLSFNSIKSINGDDNGNLWIATHYGINKLNIETEEFKRYTEEDGLSNNFTYGILLDENDDIWVSSNYGISKYDVKKNKFINFDVTDGLQGNEFNAYSYFKSKSGEMFFGGINGMTSFYPKDLVEKTFIPDVVIEDITSVGVESYDLNKEVLIEHNNNNIYINFFMPDYRNTSKIQYEYKLKGLDKEWIFSENRNYARYTNLSPGTYEFLVRGRNSSGEWSKEVSIKISINNPPWKSLWAYIIYIIVAILTIGVVLNRMKWLDKLVKQKTFELNNKLDENQLLYAELIRNEKYKNNYFVNLSHELRTPLNVILSTQQLITSLNSNNKTISKEKLDYYMLTLNRNSNRLLNLINNIIDTSKIDSGSYKLNIKEVDIVYLVEEYVLSMKDFIEGKGIELIIDPEIEEKIICCDDAEIEKCVINLIANASKFTPAGGEIRVKILDLGDRVKIIVKDTGIGIERKYHESIFNRFNQAYDKISEEHGGSGLGLTLTKQIVNLHNGEISVESTYGEGSEFIIILPVKQN